MKKLIQLGSAALLCMTLASCATNPLKAPCGPTAGLTDPCGNAKPINKPNAEQKEAHALTALHSKRSV